MKIIEVKLKDNGYKIYIEKNIFEKIAIYLKENHENKKIVIITDKNLEKLYVKALNKTIQDKNFKTKIISIEPGERSKSIDTLKKLYEDFTNFNLTRGDLILTFGGGVVGDLGGFAASTYLRGVPYIQIPTSLFSSSR
ncbi:3-dehydroquinate synthase [Clostridium carboxidivorans P7]|uniref:3-dehydroquinate synthase n=1 Tax=Clostridium carboxidivorans P7 TaxID=536227 RepID=C6PTA7_9CLOT|nr:3-dehydroquinate synthase [Clostridium carboxidivorans P7]